MKLMKTITATVAAVALTLTAVPMAASAAGKGDFDQNSRLDTNDVRKLMNTLAKGEGYTKTQMLWADFDFDSKLSTSDARQLLSAVMMDSLTPVTNYAKPTGEDWWGENAVALLGDSISWGAGTECSSVNSNPALSVGGIPEQSYVSYVKKAIQNANGGKMNYGFTSAYPTGWAGNYNGRSEELHGWPTRDNDSNGDTAWVCDNNDDGNRLMSIGFTCVTPWKTMTYQPRKDYYSKYSYFCVYYDAVDNGASFCIANGSGGEVADVNGSKTYVSTKSDVRVTKRTAFYKLSDCPKDSNGIPKIIICHDGTTNPVTITGIGYYKALPKAGNADGYVTFNSYSRGGAMLSKLSYTVLEQAAKADTLIMSLGFNDACWGANSGCSREDFLDRIDFLIEKCNENGTQVVVNDFTWSNYKTVSPYTGWNASMQAELDWRFENFSKALKRLAKETGGVYVDHEAILGSDVIIPLLPDTVHPNAEGHKLIGQNVIAALGLSDYYTTSWK
ncbi:MAG: SGNH/GDSL hydrolase family protein [Clostridia bacterium]|nr:SGNH/GDSL hydrolase family protein [Clostridia bacterium]